MFACCMAVAVVDPFLLWIGGKLMGAGGGGFFMFYVRPAERRRVYETLLARGLKPLRFRFDPDGAKIVANFHRS